MASRVIDFVYVLMLICVASSGTALMIFAIWKIGQEIMRAMHLLLTCWNFQTQQDERRRPILTDPVMRDMLTMSVPFQRVFAPFFGYSRDLARLQAYRYEKAREQNAHLSWDNRLGALLTRDEHEFLYGASPPPRPANAPLPVEPPAPSGSVAAVAS